MDSVYKNYSFLELVDASGVERTQNKGNPTENRECVREVGIPKWTKVLLISLTVSLVFALGGLCILGILYVNVSVQMSAQETNGKAMARELEELTVNYTRVQQHLYINEIKASELTANYTRAKQRLSLCEAAKEHVIEELKANYTRVREDLHINEIKLRELTANYTKVREDLHNKEVKARELTANNNRIKEQLSSCEVKTGELTASLTGVKEQLSFYKAQSSNLVNFHGKLYYFSSDKQTWSSSRDFCVSKGANLVTITSQEEQTFVHSKLKAYYWIGLTDLETEGRWVWVNGQTLQETGVQFWYQRQSQKSEPDNWKQEDHSGENCAIVKNDVETSNNWFDVSCKHTMRFICETKY